ncbi:MAG: hypothetical protein IJ529_02305 [Alphaproteobacteria bacterium]|nr:hypothetical protein [Alphaproteobacteria bacterium]MBR1600735.1 hypothetical protein [Alphaproteobacteria bacterium]
MVWKWEWVKERCSDVTAFIGGIVCLVVFGLLVWGGSVLLHWLFNLSYIVGGIISLTVLILYGRETA